MPVYYFQESKEDVPELLVDEEKGFVSIIGSSYPEDVGESYDEFLLNLKTLSISEGTSLVCELKLKVLSSASVRILHEIFILLDEFYEISKKITVNWFYEYEDEDMEEVGDSFVELFDFQFNVLEQEYL